MNHFEASQFSYRVKLGCLALGVVYIKDSLMEAQGQGEGHILALMQKTLKGFKTSCLPLNLHCAGA